MTTRPDLIQLKQHSDDKMIGNKKKPSNNNKAKNKAHCHAERQKATILAHLIYCKFLILWPYLILQFRWFVSNGKGLKIADINFFMIISYSSKLSEKKQDFKICEVCFLRFRADINSFRLNRNLQLCTTALPTPL